VRQPGSSAYSGGGLILNPTAPLPPQLQVNRDGTGTMVSWSNPSDARLTLQLWSRFTLTGNIFGGLTDVSMLTCQLSGSSGTGLISKADMDWALGLFEQTQLFRSSAASLFTWSSSGSEYGMVVRTVNSIQGSVDLR
jgi:hypothetical protein